MFPQVSPTLLFLGLYPLTLWVQYVNTYIDKSEQKWYTSILDWASKMLLIQNALPQPQKALSTYLSLYFTDEHITIRSKFLLY